MPDLARSAALRMSGALWELMDFSLNLAVAIIEKIDWLIMSRSLFRHDIGL